MAAAHYVDVSCVILLPLLDQYLRLPEAVKDLAVRHVIAKAGVQAFATAILPKRSGLDVNRFGSDGSDPVPNGQGDDLRAVVGADEGGHASNDAQVHQRVAHIS